MSKFQPAAESRQWGILKLISCSISGPVCAVGNATKRFFVNTFCVCLYPVLPGSIAVQLWELLTTPLCGPYTWSWRAFFFSWTMLLLQDGWREEDILMLGACMKICAFKVGICLPCSWSRNAVSMLMYCKAYCRANLTYSFFLWGRFLDHIGAVWILHFHEKLRGTMCCCATCVLEVYAYIFLLLRIPWNFRSVVLFF